MKLVVINPILYTNETQNIKKVNSIKDTMIYNLCLEFKRDGHEPILISSKDYEPIVDKNYDFKIIFLESKFQRIFKPNCFPLLSKLGKTLKKECGEFDLIISSEVFMMSSLYVSMKYKNKTIIWHELAKHNNILKKIPSKFWYNIIARIFFRNTRIVARSKNAQDFIRNYCNNVSDIYIDHGVSLDEFEYSKQKQHQFVVVSQLIKRKHIDGIIMAFMDFLKNSVDYKLYIIGSGDEEENLKSLVTDQYAENILFLGQMSHYEIIPVLSKSMALVINTEKDNNMLSIVEAIATATPIITTDIPYNVDYIKKNHLGVVTTSVSKFDFEMILKNLDMYVDNCVKYRECVSNHYHINQFLEELRLLQEAKR